MFDDHKVDISFQPAIMDYVEANKRIVLFLYGKRIRKRVSTSPYRQCISRKDLEHILDMVRTGGNFAPEIEEFDKAIYKDGASEEFRSPWRRPYKEQEPEMPEGYEE